LELLLFITKRFVDSLLAGALHVRCWVDYKVIRQGLGGRYKLAASVQSFNGHPATKDCSVL
jgi:hypothetical protein